MKRAPPETLSVFAPAKLNLYLHITARLPHGYHNLDSLVAFTDIGDQIVFEPSTHFQFECTGPMAAGFSAKELDITPTSDNLAVRAAWCLARETGHELNVKITLEKNLPFGAGLGGGSADAGAVLRGLLRWWGMPDHLPCMKELLPALGADVPVCFLSQSRRIVGIGDKMEEVGALPSLPVILVYPGKPCSTQRIFQMFQGKMRTPLNLATWRGADDFLAFLQTQDNVLSPAAITLIPEIDNVLQGLTFLGANLARMSGSGSCCFGLFKCAEMCEKAAAQLQDANPDWWVQKGRLLP